MAQIQPVTYPLSLGTANELTVSTSVHGNSTGGRVFYTLHDSSTTPHKRMSSGTFFLTEEQVNAEGFNETWALNYAATELGVTLVS